ncbi:hypothetical protein EMCRGX_G005228 [Ephydatia muelleri]
MCSRLLFLSFSLVLIAWTINRFKSSPLDVVPTLNYDGLVFFNHSNLHSPSSETEMVDLVRWAAHEGRKMSVVGSGHSWSAIANCQDILVSLCNYKGLVALERTLGETSVTVKAGTTLGELNTVLEEHGLAMINLGSISSQTVAGAVSTATHGTGVKFGNMATLLTKLRFVSGTGEIVTISKDGENAELFPAAAVSLGMFGIITEVTFKVRSRFTLAEKSEQYGLHNCLDNIQSLALQSEHVKLWLEVHSEMCLVVFSNETSDDLRGDPSWMLQNLKVGMFALIQDWMYLIPRSASTVMRALVTYGDMLPLFDRVDVSYNVLNIPHYFPVHSESEVCVGLDKCKHGLLQLIAVAKDNNLPLNYITEVRFIQGDDLWLSPHYHRDSCCITLLHYSPDGVVSKLYFDAYYHAAKQLHPRMHWGKYFNLNPQDVLSMYERFDDFSQARKRMDPKSIFINAFLSQTFGF